MIEILNSGPDTAAANMRLDEKLLDSLDPSGRPLLHFYDWIKPSATFGYFIDPSKHLNLKKADFHGLDLAKRPTGGGIVFHIWDLAFSFLMPASHPNFSERTLENYQFVNTIVLEAMIPFFSLKGPLKLIEEDAPSLGDTCQHFCMAKPTRYDVVYEGMKIAGAAQRKRKNGYLHQGTISLAFPQEDLLKDILLSEKEIIHAMRSYTFAPLNIGWTQEQLRETRKFAQELLREKFETHLS